MIKEKEGDQYAKLDSLAGFKSKKGINFQCRQSHGETLPQKLPTLENGLKWLNIRFFNLLESVLLRGREVGSLLVYALSLLTLLISHFYSLLFCFSFQFSLFSISLFFFSVFSPTLGYCCCSSLLLCMAKAFLYCLP